MGGILNQCIHNGFGLSEFKEELTGPEFASRFEKQVEERKIPYVLNTTVTSITKDKVVTYTNEKEGVVEVQAKAIIMAAGCYERNAGAIGIPGDRPAGVKNKRHSFSNGCRFCCIAFPLFQRLDGKCEVILLERNAILIARPCTP